MNTTNNIPEIYTGTPQSATSATIILDTNASNLDGVYTGFALRIIEGPAVVMKAFCLECKSDIAFKLDCG